MRQRLNSLYWYHATRAVAIILVFYGLAIENDAGARGTMITAAIGLLAAEPVGRRGSSMPPEREARRDRTRKEDDDSG